MSVPRRFGISAVAARGVEERIRTILDKRGDYLERAGLSGHQMKTANAWISRGLGERVTEVDGDAGYEEDGAAEVSVRARVRDVG